VKGINKKKVGREKPAIYTTHPRSTLHNSPVSWTPFGTSSSFAVHFLLLSLSLSLSLSLFLSPSRKKKKRKRVVGIHFLLPSLSLFLSPPRKREKKGRGYIQEGIHIGWFYHGEDCGAVRCRCQNSGKISFSLPANWPHVLPPSGCLRRQPPPPPPPTWRRCRL
jgi:hypothetical protein